MPEGSDKGLRLALPRPLLEQGNHLIAGKLGSWSEGLKVLGEALNPRQVLRGPILNLGHYVEERLTDEAVQLIGGHFIRAPGADAPCANVSSESAFDGVAQRRNLGEASCEDEAEGCVLIWLDPGARVLTMHLDGGRGSS